MFQPKQHDSPSPKCFFTSSTLPSFVDHEQVPRKKRPFCTIEQSRAVHTVEVVIPRETCSALQRSLNNDIGISNHTYAKVHMSLSQIISGEFFRKYIKTGNIILLSQGRPGIDPVYTLIDGILRLEIDKPTYERLGLKGEPISSPGRKHEKARFAVELNFRLPSMVRGKKGFERVLWAFKNVLGESVTWLFCDLAPSHATGELAPIREFSPVVKTVVPEISDFANVVVPRFLEEIGEGDEDVVEELLEWISFVNLASPRVREDDDMDAYLSRYRVPDFSKVSDDSQKSVAALSHIRWHGLLPAHVVLRIYLAALKAAGNEWFTFIATRFEGKTYTILQDRQHTMTWEYSD